MFSLIQILTLILEVRAEAEFSTKIDEVLQSFPEWDPPDQQGPMRKLVKRESS